jgi:hypothetical protein
VGSLLVTTHKEENMIVYQVTCGIVTPLKVVKKTPSGWRVEQRYRDGDSYLKFVKDTGFSPSYFHVEDVVYTEGRPTALTWASYQRERMEQMCQVGRASVDDLKDWVEDGEDEDHLPKPRWGEWY